MATVLNASTNEALNLPRIAVVERLSGLLWRDDNMPLPKIIRMQGTVDQIVLGLGAGQIFPTNQTS